MNYETCHSTYYVGSRHLYGYVGCRHLSNIDMNDWNIVVFLCKVGKIQLECN